MMKLEIMKQIIDLFSELEGQGVYGFDLHNKEFHVSYDMLLSVPVLHVEERGSVEYRYAVYAEYDGFKIFALVKQEQLKEFPQLKAYRKQLLLQQLAELESEEETLV